VDVLSHIFIKGLYSRLQESPSDLPGDMLFAMFLAFTIPLPSSLYSPTRALDALRVAALSGYEPAQSAVLAAYNFFVVEPPIQVDELVIEWLKSAVASGSALAKFELQKLDEPALCIAISDFRNNGGYNKFYYTVDPSSSDTGTPRNQGTNGISFRYSHIHWLAIYDTLPALLDYFNKNNENEIDGITDNQETPLYLACARGSSDVAAELLRRGACPSVKCTTFEISCMHWIFAFDEDIQAEAVVELRSKGAHLNALTCQEVPFLHYPFLLPAGTPLHWAVATSSHTGVRALVKNGAHLLIRDGSDPYLHDGRVRRLGYIWGPNLEAYGPSETRTQGLSPLDLAAIQHDPFIFELLISLKCDVDINAVDEEGFSVLHRLSTNHVNRTRTGNTYSTLPFRGSRAQMRGELRRTIAAIKALGADMELLTTPFGWKGRPTQSSSTPLMLAVMNPATDVVRALLEAGASVHTENNQKETALLCLAEDGPENEAAYLEIIGLLVSYGADINQRDKFGSTVIFRAAGNAAIDAVEFCLSKGAYIDEQIQGPSLEFEGKNVFHRLAGKDNPLRFKNDLKLARLLERHVFACQDPEKKRRVIECGDIDGETLLHRFASNAMLHCVQILVRHDAPINALKQRHTQEREGDFDFKLSWYETPLDAALRTKEDWMRDMETTRKHSKQHYEEFFQGHEAVITVLQQAGGVSASKEVVRKPFIFDRSRYGNGEYGRVFREW
jgi:ankyrin repeat protein